MKVLNKLYNYSGCLLYALRSTACKKDKISIKPPKNFYILNNVLQEKQIHNECSGYSSAFLLRYFGKSAAGIDVYNEMKFKIPSSGYALPFSILEVLSRHGIDYRIMRGNLQTLKARLSLGKPLIVLIGYGLEWQHYITLLGYDEEKKELYFFDSLKNPLPSSKFSCNSSMKEDAFLSFWENGIPFYEYIYLAPKD
ncbi:hypothetical protein IAI10_19995 [Clostridium sp. 19966]|uniref:hypothetical protein n=1 Tax=Clostridium sp. 19966 TaxID=2768166 RepID=UPI0028DEB630|nr:hypothetical protein [Clostridium sp. 19966]MDT8718938.1 hypothetical protein [Clostridium sp. 19966]